MRPILDVTSLLTFGDAWLIDAFGVLVDHSGARPGAAAFVEAITERGDPWMVLTNDAARSPAQAAAWYRSLGLAIDDERVLTSGAMVATTLHQQGLASADVLALGPDDSLAMLRDAGVHLVDTSSTFDVLVVCDEMGFPFHDTVNHIMSELILAAKRGALPPCFVANPDVIYPTGGGRFAMAAGAVARLFEEAVNVHHDVGRFFVPLGKPAAPIFKEAMRRLGHAHPVMLGDTLHTDIRGAQQAGLRAVLVGDHPLLHLARQDADPKQKAPELCPDAFLPEFFADDR